MLRATSFVFHLKHLFTLRRMGWEPFGVILCDALPHILAFLVSVAPAKLENVSDLLWGIFEKLRRAKFTQAIGMLYVLIGPC